MKHWTTSTQKKTIHLYCKSMSTNTVSVENKEQDTACAKYAAFYIHILLISCYIREYTDKVPVKPIPVN